MERSKAKKAGRKKLVRERSDALKDKPPRKAPSKEVIKQAGRYHAIETAKKQLNEAKQAVASDQDQHPYTAVDKVESYSVKAAHDVLNALPSLSKRNKQMSYNYSFHDETDFVDEGPHQPTAKERMRRKAIKETKQKQQEDARKAFHRDTFFNSSKPQEDPIDTTTRRDAVYLARKRTVPHRTRIKEPPAANFSGLHHQVFPHTPSFLPDQRNTYAKEHGRLLAIEKAKALVSSQSRRNGKAAFVKTGGRLISTLKTELAEAVSTWKLLAVMLVPVLLFFVIAAVFSDTEAPPFEHLPVSDEVEMYTPLIRFYAYEYEIPEFTALIKAVMMQESRGLGTDPMQCSESPYNTRYPSTPGGITDPEYSIEVGVHSLASVLNQAGAENPTDIDGISLALQGYNFGSGYIDWALENGGYSEQSALEYSEIMAERLGWTSYGDPNYVSHVMRYYRLENGEVQ